MWEKQISARTIRIQKRKLGVNTRFSEIIELKFAKKIAIHSLYFLNKAFLESWLINYPCKVRGYPHFSFTIPITLAKIYFFPIVITFAKIHLYKEAPSLIVNF